MCRKLFFFVFVVLAMGLLGPGQDDAAGADPNFVLWYKLDESGTTTNVPDSSGYNHHGTIETWVEGEPDPDPNWDPDGGHDGGCLIFFDETRINVPKSTLNNVTTGITVSLWVKDAWRLGQNWTFDAATDWEEPFRITAAIGTAPDAEVLWQAGNDTNDALRWDGGNVQDLEGWHLWTFVKDETADNIRIYLDGVPAASKTGVDDTLRDVLPTELDKEGFVFHVGASSSHWNHLKAKVDEFVVYDRALSDDEVVRLYYTAGDLAVAWKPEPADGVEDLCDDVVLSWTPGDYVDDHNVYFGDSLSDVDASATPVEQNWGPNTYTPTGLESGTTYYWRIETVKDGCDASPWEGDVWQFTINDGNAFDPDPADGEEAVMVEAVLSWSSGCWAASHDVYFGTDYNEVRNGTGDTFKGNQPLGDTDYDPCDFGYLTDYYWRIDEVNGTTWKGQVWSFRSQTEIIDINCTLWYELDETEGYIAHDSSNYLHHGIVDMPGGGPPAWDPLDGLWGGSLAFSDDTAIWVPTATLSNVRNGVAVVFWAKDPRNPILHVNGGDSQLLVSSGSSQVLWRAGNDTNDVLTWDYDGSGRPAGWHHWAFVKNESAGNISIYFNGSLAASDDVVDSTLVNIRNKPFKIGAETWQDGDFSGKIDDFIVYDRALSGNEIARQYEAGGPVGKLELAWLPNPRNRATEVARDVVLSWTPGDYAADPNAHEIYFGTSWNDVNDANNSLPVGTSVYKGAQDLDSDSYDPPGFLELGRTYYWRIDEVNDANNDRWKGNIWRFTVADYITIDNIEDYQSTTDLRDNGWIEGSQNWTGSYLFLQIDTPVRGEQSMKYVYDNTFDWFTGYYYSEIESRNLDPNNWTVLDGRILTLWFYGKVGNDTSATEQMYVGLEDSDGNYAEVRYGDGEGEDMNDIRIAKWQEWNIPLSDFTNVNMAKLDKLFIGFGIRGNMVPGGGGLDHWVHFDDIRLYPPYCVPGKGPKADLSGNCIVDFADIEIMADAWLETDVNLGEVIKPDANGLVGWWRFDEAAADTNIAHDYAGDNNGVIETLNVDVWWVAAGHDGNALEFDGGRVRVPDAQALKPLHQVSASAWIYYSEGQSAARIVVKGGNDKETYEIEVSDKDTLVFQVRDGNDPDAESYPRYAAESNDATLDRDEWIHVAGTYDGNAVKCYINGELAATNNDANAIVFLSQDTNDLAIGNMCDDDRAPFEGTIDDVRVYNYALSLEEIRYIATDGTKIFSVQSVANLYNKEDLGERAVNLRDYAELAKDWLDVKLYPE